MALALNIFARFPRNFNTFIPNPVQASHKRTYGAHRLRARGARQLREV